MSINTFWEVFLNFDKKDWLRVKHTSLTQEAGEVVSRNIWLLIKPNKDGIFQDLNWKVLDKSWDELRSWYLISWNDVSAIYERLGYIWENSNNPSWKWKNIWIIRLGTYDWSSFDLNRLDWWWKLIETLKSWIKSPELLELVIDSWEDLIHCIMFDWEVMRVRNRVDKILGEQFSLASFS
jgi:hypothetical protein